MEWRQCTCGYVTLHVEHYMLYALYMLYTPFANCVQRSSVQHKTPYLSTLGSVGYQADALKHFPTRFLLCVVVVCLCIFTCDNIKTWHNIELHVCVDICSRRYGYLFRSLSGERASSLVIGLPWWWHGHIMCHRDASHYLPLSCNGCTPLSPPSCPHVVDCMMLFCAGCTKIVQPSRLLLSCCTREQPSAQPFRVSDGGTFVAPCVDLRIEANVRSLLHASTAVTPFLMGLPMHAGLHPWAAIRCPLQHCRTSLIHHS